MGGNYYLLAAVITALVGIIPLFIRQQFAAAGVTGIIAFFVLWFLFWAMAPSTVYPFWGPAGAFVLVLWVICAVVDGVDEGSPTWITAIPVAAGVILIGSLVMGWAALGNNARVYSSMIGPIEERNWTQDVQPKDPRHMRMVSGETAVFLAKKAVAQGGSIGSQFELNIKATQLQRVHGELVYVFPLDFRGFTTWTSSTGVPAFIVVYAEDPERTPRLVTLPKEKFMSYTPGAFWNYDLERHMRNNGFLNDGLDSVHLELDEEENPHWVVTTYQLTVTWFAEKVTGVAVVNPTTGDIKRYTVDRAPAWIDRIVPSEYAEAYLDWRGQYAGGWWNHFWANLNITTAEKPILIYGEGDKSEFVIGITSKSEKDDSLVGLMYMDSRTGKTVYYKVNGGATDTAIMKAVNSNSLVKYKHLTATTPQIYNVYGNMAAVVPLINDIGAYSGVAIVSVLNVQDVASGSTQSEALRNYQTLAARQGQQIAVEKTHTAKKLTGVVDRIRQDVGQNGGVYLFHIEGAPRIFTASSNDHVKLPLTQVGDPVLVEYVASGEDVVPVQSFDNISLPLDKTTMQDEVERAAKARQSAEVVRKGTADLVKEINTMSPEKLKRLQELLRQTN